MIDKRALVNEEMYEKLEAEITDIQSKIKFDEVSKREKAIIDDVGDCILSLQNPIDALESGDCFGIGLSINRPEAAIADPSRMVVLDIVPTYLTVDSFLESAKFKLLNQQGDDTSVHGGFKGKDSTVD